MATTKQVKVLARYIHKTDGKPNGRISYLVESSDGKSQYCTTIINGKASGCSCPSRKPCYHMTQLEAKESEWTQYRAELAKKLAAVYMTSQVVEQIAEQLVSPKKVKVAKVIKQAVEAKVPAPKPDMMNAALTTNQGFRMMR